MSAIYSTEETLRRDLARYSGWIAQLGFAPGTSGNLSARLDRYRLLVTPTGMSKRFLKPEDMVVVGLDGQLLAGDRNATSELSMHLAIYRLREDVHAVIHSHPPIATAFACSGRGLDDRLCQEAIMTLGSVPLALYATTGTDEVAASLTPFIPGHDAILLENHGSVTCGASVLEAFLRTETLEHLAQVTLACHQLGSPRRLSATEVAQLQHARMKYAANAAAVDDHQLCMPG
ncbi:MAG TPA: class II aldolase/adducin family protein [Candidatus Aquilonibacter sp.]|nr:class II aldolase/adducin family protein [Candidatus Aquilonibacter sp.]